MFHVEQCSDAMYLRECGPCDARQPQTASLVAGRCRAATQDRPCNRGTLAGAIEAGDRRLRMVDLSIPTLVRGGGAAHTAPARGDSIGPFVKKSTLTLLNRL